MTTHTAVIPVRYYETDRMGIVHHSNYVRYLEIARLEFLDSVGVNFADFEAAGFVSPVLGVSLAFKRPARYGDTVSVTVRIKQYKGARIRFAYEITAADGGLLAEGESEHTFCTADLRPVNLAKRCPEAYAKLIAATL